MGTGVPFQAQSSMNNKTIFGRSVPMVTAGEDALAVKQQLPANTSAATIPMLFLFIVTP
jgi:hypothetical protein